MERNQTATGFNSSEDVFWITEAADYYAATGNAAGRADSSVSFMFVWVLSFMTCRNTNSLHLLPWGKRLNHKHLNLENRLKHHCTLTPLFLPPVVSFPAIFFLSSLHPDTKGGFQHRRRRCVFLTADSDLAFVPALTETSCCCWMFPQRLSMLRQRD